MGTMMSDLRAENERLLRLIADIRIKFPEVDAWLLSDLQKEVREAMAILDKRRRLARGTEDGDD